MDKIAYLGFSWGAAMGIIFPVVDKRYSSLIFIGGAIHPNDKLRFPEANSINFAPRIQVPKLMLAGRHDEAVVYKTMALPLYNLLNEPKRLELVDGGHLPALEIRVPIINNWLDETLGPVKFE